MKLRQATILSFLASAGAFSVVPRASMRSSRRLFSAVANDFGTDVTDGASVFEQLGIEQGKLALGVRPDEVLKYIGTREDLIAKTLADIPSFDRNKAETEVDKFLMDCDMLNIYIQYGKEIEKNPDFVVPENNNDEGLFNARNLVIGYLGYVVATSVPQVFRRYVAEQEVAGQWKPTNIQFIDEWIERTSPEATARVLQKAAEAAGESLQQTTQAASDVVVQSVDTLQTVADAVQAGGLQ